MRDLPPLPPEKLAPRCKAGTLPFETTNELENLSRTLGQDRAMEAIQFGLNMEQKGYNICAIGPHGVGKHTLICELIKKHTENKGPAYDWCYVYNFNDPDRPVAINFPAGSAKTFRSDIHQLITSITHSFQDGTLTDTIHKLKQKYQAIDKVVLYLDALQHDLLDNASDLNQDYAPNRYRVNVLVTHPEESQPPIVYEDHPTPLNLFGRIDYTIRDGSYHCDFMSIKPGALHRANGGYLLIDLNDILNEDNVWDDLKRALYNGSITIEASGKMSEGITTHMPTPEPIPLNLKIILVSDRSCYYLLASADTHFAELFKVVADFENQIPRTDSNQLLYARLIRTIASKEKLMPFDRTAVGRIIDRSVRIAGDREKLSTHIQLIDDLMCEAHMLAKKEHKQVVEGKHIAEALALQERRVDRYRGQIYEEILRGVILVDTSGSHVGQVNGLSVLSLAQFAFGQPIRITATARYGDGDIVDIEREVDLGGSLHSKGVLILSKFLGERYAKNFSLSLNGSIVFEQSYDQVDGDSASAAELCALLSAISDIPIKQNIAITGSVNQFGQIQAIGYVNEKIESFFDICSARKLNGTHGVLIPTANIKHLMLRDDVVEAAEQGLFNIYGIDTIDQAMSMLTGKRAGRRNKDGKFPKNTINHFVEMRLEKFAKASKSSHHKVES